MTRAAVLALLLAGCATAGPANYEPGKVAPEQFARDSAACEMAAAQSQTMGGYTGAMAVASYYDSYNRVYDPCMRAKGYARKP